MFTARHGFRHHVPGLFSFSLRIRPHVKPLLYRLRAVLEKLQLFHACLRVVCMVRSVVFFRGFSFSTFLNRFERGYDLHSVRKVETELERENRILKEQNAALLAVIRGAT